MRPRLLDDDALRDLARTHGTPLYVQDADRVAARIADLAAFDVVRYAMKANPGLALLQHVRRAGAHVDCVSEGELRRARVAGFTPGELCLTADLFGRGALALVIEEEVPVNLGSADMLEQYAEAGGRLPVTLRVNPGFGHGHDRKVNTGGARSKHGIWHEELAGAVARARAAGLVVGGLHMHIGSGSDMEHLLRVCGAMRDAARLVGDELRTISGGGGLPVPYRPSDAPLDLARYAAAWVETRDALAAELGAELAVEVEPGRYLVAEAGCVLTEVRAVKEVAGVPHVLVDAGFHTLARPMMYGAYHAISLVGEARGAPRPTVVAGPLCEAADVFTQDASGAPRPQDLPPARPGDLMCLHDTGAYGASMASNYNSMPIAAEVLVEGGVPRLVRPRQTHDELMAAERARLAEEPA